MSNVAEISALNGVGPRIQELLAQLGVETLEDLLFHLPSRYQDRTRITAIASLHEHDQALIEGEVQRAAITPGRKPSLVCELKDATGSIHLRFFHFTAAQKNQLQPGVRLRCFGEARRAFRHFGLEMAHPEYRQLQHAHEMPLENHLTPIYPAIPGLSQTLLRKLIKQVLQNLQKNSPILEFLPANLLSSLQFPSLISALMYVHQPPPDADVDLLLRGEHPMQKRLAFEELVAQQLILQKSRQYARQENAACLSAGDELRAQLTAQLGFALTAAQRRVIAEIDADLMGPAPMLRLVQGDVGSGKTIVAAMVMLRAVVHGGQAVLAAPTELLAEQHYQNFCRWLAPLGIRVGYMGGKPNATLRAENLAAIAQGEWQVIIGTHALFQEKVQYARLVLLVIDEQHRFGVQQRLTLREKGKQAGYSPHQLIMSATPIPRTLAMAAYADLDISVIDELPPGRRPVTTVMVSSNRRNEVITRVRLACREHKQVYWVCTLIEESEALQCRAAEDTAVELQGLLADLKVELIHSRLRADEKSSCMQRFKQGQIDVLVATTVIEVGVDVPNASLMIIENPERLGLSQLHQLRGRVGRGNTESFCVLLFKAPLSALARQRLQVMRQTSDGFVIAREDLAIRGPGEVLGTRQAGLVRLRIADLLRDQELLPQAQATARILLAEFPQQAQGLIKRWMRHADQYLHV